MHDPKLLPGALLPPTFLLRTAIPLPSGAADFSEYSCMCNISVPKMSFLGSVPMTAYDSGGPIILLMASVCATPEHNNSFLACQR